MRIFVAAITHKISHRLTCEGVTVALVNLFGASDDRQCYCEYVEYSFHFFFLVSILGLVWVAYNVQWNKFYKINVCLKMAVAYAF